MTPPLMLPHTLNLTLHTAFQGRGKGGITRCRGKQHGRRSRGSVKLTLIHTSGHSLPGPGAFDIITCMVWVEYSCLVNGSWNCLAGPHSYLELEIQLLINANSLASIKSKYTFINKCCFTQKRKAKLHFKIYLCTTNCFKHSTTGAIDW